MTITYTGNLKLALPTTGTEAGTWGDVVNQQITALLDQSVSGTVSLTSMTNADYTLTNGNGSSPNEARYMALSVPSTLTLTAARNIIVPTSSKAYIIRNLTTGGFAVTLKTSAGTGISVPNGKTMILYCDGTNVIDGTDYFTSIATGNLSYTGTLTGGTGIVNIGSGQVYKDASGNVGLGVTPSAWSSNSKPLQAADASFWGSTSLTGYASIGGNYYYDGTYKYIKTSTATDYFQYQGAHVWRNAPSGTAGNAITFTQAMTLDASGNLGLGVTPSAWTTYKAIQLGATTPLAIDSSGAIGINYFYDGAYKYVGTSYAALYSFATGQHRWFTAPSGTAGNAITFTQAMTLDASGNLGLGVTPKSSYSVVRAFEAGDAGGSLLSGTTSFSADQYLWLSNNQYMDASGTFKAARTKGVATYKQFNAEHQWLIASGTANSAITFTQAMTLDANGKLAIGTTSAPSGTGVRAVISNANGGGLQFDQSGSGGAILPNGAAAGLKFYSYTGGVGIETYTERARIDASGNLLVGVTAPRYGGGSARIYAAGTSDTQPAMACDTDATTSQQQIKFINPNGIVGTITTNGTATAYNTSSDYRLKNITGPITTSGAYIDSLKPVEGTWKADDSAFVGLIAHEVQEASRTPVATGTKDGSEMQAMNYSSAEIIANLIAELQSLRARVAQLESKP